jgi:hypothetical protein
LPLQPVQKVDDATLPAATATVRHGHVNVNPPSGSPRVYLNINDAFSVFDTASIPWARSAVTMSGTGADAAEGDYGGFLGFGQHEVYWQGHNKNPRIRLAGAGNFIDLCTTPAGNNAPRPRFMAPCGDRLAMFSIGNTVAAGVGTPDPDPDLFWFSKSRDGRTWGTEASHPADRTGYAFLRDDFGGGTGLWGSNEYALAFKRRGLWRVDFQGTFGNSYRIMDNLQGCRSHRTICALGRDVFFWSDSGPCVYRNDQVVPLGADIILSMLLATDDPTPSSITVFRGCFADPLYQVVTWMFDVLDAESLTKTVALCYAVPSDRFSVLFDEGGTAYKVSPSYAVDSDLSYPDIFFGGLPMPPIFCGNQAVLLYGKSGGGRPRLLTFQAGNSWMRNETTLRTGYLALGRDRSVVVQKVRPVFRGHDSAYSSGTIVPYFRITVFGKTSPFAAEFGAGEEYSLSGGVSQLDQRGFLAINATAANLVSFFMEVVSISDQDGVPAPSRFASDIRELEGLEVEYVYSGRKI